MKNIIHHLRNKPDHVKSRYVVVFSVIATAIVVGLWIMTMQLTKTKDDIVKTESPFAVFGKLFSGAVSDVSKNYSAQKKSLEASLPTATDTQSLQDGGVDAATFYGDTPTTSSDAPTSVPVSDTTQQNPPTN